MTTQKQQAEWRAKQIATGYCVKCPKKAMKDHLRCKFHVEWERQYNQIKKNRNRANGCCDKCSQKRIKGQTLCLYHKNLGRQYYKERHQVDKR